MMVTIAIVVTSLLVFLMLESVRSKFMIERTTWVLGVMLALSALTALLVRSLLIDQPIEAALVTFLIIGPALMLLLIARLIVRSMLHERK